MLEKLHLTFFLLVSTLESRIIGGVGIIGEMDIVMIFNNRVGWTGLKK